MLRFFKGASGSGKSRLMLERINKDISKGERVYLIVPEQYSYEAEKLVYDVLGFDAANKLKVLSFERLYGEIFARSGEAETGFVSEQTKLIAMSLALAEVKDALESYGTQTDKPGFAEDMLALWDELCTSDIPVCALDGVTDEDEALYGKAREISVILSSFEGILASMGGSCQTKGKRAARLCEEQDYFCGATVYIDEFRSFTAAELDFLEQIIRQAKEVNINLCIGGSGGIFTVPEQTAAKLEKICERNGVAFKTEETCREIKRFKNEELKYFSENIFRRPIVPFKYDCGSISAAVCPDVYSECDYVCAKIRELVMGGLRFGDIAVIGRDLEGYSNALEASVSKYEIPVFFDRRESVLKKALITLVMSVFSGVSLNTESILCIAKTGFAGVTTEEASELENYCFEWGIKGGMWAEDFAFACDEREARVNLTRKYLVEPLEEFKNKTENADGGRICTALYELLEKYGVPSEVDKKAKALLSSGREEQARELKQIWDVLVDTLDTMFEALSGKKITRKRFCELFRVLAAKATVSLPPQTIDSVIIGSAERIRLGDKKAVIIIGANEGVFPSNSASGPVFSNRERKKLSEMGIELFYPDEKTQSEERFIAYKAVSAPSERLIITYPCVGADFAEKFPSEIVTFAKRIFGDEILVNTSLLPKSYFCKTCRSAFDYLAGGIDDRNSDTESIYEAVRRTRLLADKQTLLERNKDFSSFKIENTRLMSELSGKTVKVSATRIQDYYECKFRHFCKYGLGLYPLKKRELSNAVSGTIIHYCLENVVRTYGRELVNMDRAALEDVISELINGFVEEQLGGFEGKSEIFKNSIKKLSPKISGVLLRIAEEMKYCQFVPSDFELSIGPDGEVVPKKIISDGGKEITVLGSVDRTDTCEIDGRKYVRVIDYKSGKKKEFSLSNVYYGLNIQLLLYLFIITSGEGKYSGYIPAGALYYSSREPKKKASDKTRHYTEQGLRDAVADYYRMNGILLKDEKVIAAMDSTDGVFIPKGKDSSCAAFEDLEKLHRHCERLIRRIADEFESGDISAAHLTARDIDSCQYCDYSAVCRRQLGVAEDAREELSGEEIYQNIENEENDEYKVD